MKIVADRDIWGVEETFSPFGELVLLPGREITGAHLKGADALLVRTVTRIDAALVKGASLRFVGSATSGTDHVDTTCLAEAGIGFCHAPGCNADAVVNYVMASLAWLGRERGIDWRSRSTGIIGAGNVGGRLARVLIALGLDVAIYDPLLDESHPLAPHFASLDEVLSRKTVSVHVPLTRNGPHPTFHMLDADRLAMLGPDAILVNAARGEVVDNLALDALLSRRPQQVVVLDTWENEPVISTALLDKVAFGTPHIAGYSLQGKRNGTRAVLQGFCGLFGLSSKSAHHEPSSTELAVPLPGSDPELLDRLILQAYPVDRDFLPRGEKDMARTFDRLRNGYALRKEFREFCVPAGLPAALAADLVHLGFGSA